MITIFGILASFLALGAGAAPWNVPRVESVDQSPTRVADYGKCTSAIEPYQRNHSHWCKHGRLQSWPESPNAVARKWFKFGIQTLYNGPRKHLAHCNIPLVGTNAHAIIAVSSKYLKPGQGGWSKDKGACHKCMCVHVLGADISYNKGVQKWVVQKYKGLTFLGKVGDKLGEGSDDAIDVFRDRPYAFSALQDNKYAQEGNAISGLRAFTSLVGPESPESVGTWTAMWQFVPCGNWTHEKCAHFVRSYGYRSWTPSWKHGTT